MSTAVKVEAGFATSLSLISTLQQRGYNTFNLLSTLCGKGSVKVSKKKKGNKHPLCLLFHTNS